MRRSRKRNDTHLVVGKWGFWDITTHFGPLLKMGVLGHYDSFWTTFIISPKFNRKNEKKIKKKIKILKIKNLSFFIKKLGQEIKNRSKPDKSGLIRKSFQGH